MAVAGAVVATAVAAWTAIDVARAPARAGRGAAASQRAPHFWRSRAQIVAIAERHVRDARLQRPLAARAYRLELGLWEVSLGPPAKPRELLLIEDRSGDVLESSPWAWSSLPTKLTADAERVELVCLALAVVFLALLFDVQRPFSLANLDVVSLLALGVPFALSDRGHPFLSVPLIYPPLAYLAVRLVSAGFRRQRAPRRLAAWASGRTLFFLLLALIFVRVGFNVALGGTSDISYASVFGAENIRHGWPLYMAGANHLDAYGPVNYLAYVPFDLLFPMQAGLVRGHLWAAHAAAVSFDLLTMLALFLLGRQLADRGEGRRHGLGLAVAYAACPFTFLPVAWSSNDGLPTMLVLWALVAISSPARRGFLLGLAAATKFAPLALAGVLAAGRGRRRPRQIALFTAVLAAVICIAVWAYLPASGLALFWDKTIGFQLGRHSFTSIWGQQPELRPLQLLVMAAAAALASIVVLVPRERDTAAIAALAGAVVISLELSMTVFAFEYVAWFVPLLLVACFGRARECAPHTPAKPVWARETHTAEALTGVV